MRVGIYKSRKDDFVSAIDLENFLAVLPQPRITQGIFRRADRNDFSAEAEYSRIFDDAQTAQIMSAAWSADRWGRSTER